MEEFARNIARMMEEGGKALAAYLKPREEGRRDDQYAEITDVVKTIGQVADYWLRDPQRALELQSSLGKAYLDLWANAVKRMAGEQVQPVAEPDPQGQALRRSRMVEQPVLRFPQAGLSPDGAMGEPAGARRRKGSIRIPGRRPISTCARSPTRSRRRISCSPIRSFCAKRSPRTPRISCAACTCWPRTSRPAAAISRSASPDPKCSRSAAISRSRPAR